MGNWEERAITSVRNGAPDVEALYMAYREPMLRTAAGKLRGENNTTLGLSAEDVVEEVIAGILDGSVALKPEIANRLRAHLRTVVRNKAVDLMRQRGAESRALGRRHPVELSDIETDVETMVLAEQAEARMGLLNDNERHVIIENVKQRRQSKDVAAELGCSPQNISHLRKSAVRKLTAGLPFEDATSPDPGGDTLIEHRKGGSR